MDVAVQDKNRPRPLSEFGDFARTWTEWVRLSERRVDLQRRLAELGAPGFRHGWAEGYYDGLAEEPRKLGQVLWGRERHAWHQLSEAAETLRRLTDKPGGAPAGELRRAQREARDARAAYLAAADEYEQAYEQERGKPPGSRDERAYFHTPREKRRHTPREKRRAVYRASIARTVLTDGVRC